MNYVDELERRGKWEAQVIDAQLDDLTQRGKRDHAALMRDEQGRHDLGTRQSEALATQRRYLNRANGSQAA
ncbi:MAG TPA: hypothetical protein VEW42_05840 [Candidatus Eisenbacteria bacterium]|nr:hypothetical protein [Candidatus Eisenbacteria bacterium]